MPTTESVRNLKSRTCLFAQDQKNMPGRDDMREIIKGCCRANATLYVVESKTGLRLTPKDCNGTGPTQLKREHRPFRHSRTCGRYSTTHLGARAMALLNNLTALLTDETNQRKHYLSDELLQRIDVGIVWQSGRQPGGHIAVQNRPPTRMHWWWSHAIPVIGYPTEVS